jgi:hypothetical protein
MSKTSKTLATLLAASLSFSGLAQAASGVGASLIGTEQVAARSAEPARSAAHARLLSALDRSDLAQALGQRGLSVDQARERVAALSDAEAARLAQEIDQAPAGADGVLGTLVFIFVLLLVTDILGLTKIFPFTRSVR